MVESPAQWYPTKIFYSRIPALPSCQHWNHAVMTKLVNGRSYIIRSPHPNITGLLSDTETDVKHKWLEHLCILLDAKNNHVTPTGWNHGSDCINKSTVTNRSEKTLGSHIPNANGYAVHQHCFGHQKHNQSAISTFRIHSIFKGRQFWRLTIGKWRRKTAYLWHKL